jgi:hypothetical protein
MISHLHYHMRFDTNCKFKGGSNHEIEQSNSKSRAGTDLLLDHHSKSSPSDTSYQNAGRH